jgi:hypothetical protein
MLLIYFYPPGRTAGSPGYDPHNKRGWMSVPIDEMPTFIDVLRNEKPIWAYVNSEKPNGNGFRTGVEPVGEEE